MVTRLEFRLHGERAWSYRPINARRIVRSYALWKRTHESPLKFYNIINIENIIIR